MTTLEDKIIAEFKEGKTSVERTLLAVSGLQTEEEIASYQRKLDFIQKDFERYCGRSLPETEFQTAKALFDYFWETKPNRYNGDFLLVKVIDNQLDEDKDKTVGNCVGLTSLYSVLGLRVGLDLSVFIGLDHILTLLHCGNREIVVENVKGFRFNSKLESRYEKKDLIRLVSSVFCSRGFERKNLGDLEGALFYYSRAIELESDYADAFNNRGVVKSELGDSEDALRDYNKAIELKPDYAYAFNNRGIAREKLDDSEGALLDYDKAIELKPDYADAFINRGIAREELDDSEGALLDYDRAIELNPNDDYAKRNKERLLRKLNQER